MSTGVATGSATSFALGLERREGVPRPGLIGYGPVLPVAAELVAATGQSAQINRSGYGRKGVPGAITGPVSWGHPLTAAHQLEFFEHIMGRSSKVDLGSGVFRYTFTPSLVGCVDTSFWVLVAKGEVELFLRTGVKFAQMAVPIANNAETVATLTGDGLHGAKLGMASPSAGNTGTYTLGPWGRGTLSSPESGSIWIRIENLAPLRYKVLQASAEPNAAAWTGATLVQEARIVEGEGYFSHVLDSQTLEDLGIFDSCNKDPLEIAFPGAPADHAALAVGDVFELPISWSAPALAELPEAGCYTTAHWITEFGPEGGPLAPMDFDSGNWTLGWPLAASPGNASRYRSNLYKTGEFSSATTLVRPHRDNFFADAAQAQRHLNRRMAWEGQILADGFRESIEILEPSVEVTSSARPVANSEINQETIVLNAKTNTDGDPPTTVNVQTDRDWNPSPQG